MGYAFVLRCKRKFSNNQNYPRKVVENKIENPMKLYNNYPKSSFDFPGMSGLTWRPEQHIIQANTCIKTIFNLPTCVQ
jgi:hypothetical protein